MDLASTDLDRFMKTAWHHRGSDVLLTVGTPPLVRIDGQLRPIAGEQVLAEDDVANLVEQVLNDVQLAEFHRVRRAPGCRRGGTTRPAARSS